MEVFQTNYFGQAIFVLKVHLLAISFDPLLIYFYEGLVETKHPYNFISRAGIKDLLESKNSYMKTAELSNSLISKLRICFMSSNDEVFSNGLYGLRYLSNCLGQKLDDHLKYIISQVSKGLDKKTLRVDTIETLELLESNGVILEGK